MDTREFHVYILRCADNALYIGVTNDIRARLHQHQHGINPRSFTFRRRPVRLVHSVFFESIYEAIAFEKQIKRWSRAKKEALIRGDATSLQCLSYARNRYVYLINQRTRVFVRRILRQSLDKLGKTYASGRN